jgi:tetratricopeptide (TPR) repeat protein
MKRSEFEDALRQLSAAKTIARARMLVRELIQAAPRMDAPLRADLLRIAATHGISVARIDAAALAVGEAWVLLFEAPNTGCVARLRATFGRHGDERLSLEVRRAFRGLVRTAAKARRRIDHHAPPAVDIDAPYARFEIEGSSLGLSVAIATLSVITGRSPLSAVAASAQVRDDGTLAPVEHLVPKLAALAKSAPEVTRVVVARGQIIQGYQGPIEIVAAEHLAQALALSGLALEELCEAHSETYVDHLASLRSENNRPHAADEWRRLSIEAWEIAAALVEDDREKSAEALVLASLFAIHAGDPSDAAVLLREVSDIDAMRYPELHARKLIAAASRSIDVDRFAEATAFAQEAIALCDSPRQRDRELLGQALGTQGRALLHSGDAVSAEPILRRAVELHRQFCPRERPRSACYLATCLRKMGHLSEALDTIDDALAELARPRWDLDVTTALYLRLERGRIVLALGDATSAIKEFELVKAGQSGDSSYPRAGAMRDLARALRFVHEDERAHATLAACVATARSMAERVPTIARVAGAAAGEAILDGVTSIAATELADAWRAAFGGDASPEPIRQILRNWVY